MNVFVASGMAIVPLILFIAWGLAFAAATCAVLLPFFRRWGILKRAYEDAPQTHQKKTGTPTMGGICFVVALLPIVMTYFDPAFPVPAFLGSWRWRFLGLFGLVALCAVVGALDDLLAIRSKEGRGLRARTKFLLTALIAVMFLRAIAPQVAPVGTILTLPGFTLMVPYWLWLILGIVAVAGTIHAVNLTDGLDGLAAGSMVAPLVAFGVIGIFAGAFAAVFAALLGAGACLGFLIYNRHPAKLFMGDTGSLALGALLSGVAILTGEMLLLIVIGFVFVAEALSVIIQVAYFKLTHGKRIFKMSPLHHHFELSGWPESKVTARFWIASTICSLVGLAIAR